MDIHGLDGVLRSHPFFKDLPEAFLNTVVGCAKNTRHKAGEFLFREKQAANEFFLIREGQLAIEINSPKFGPIPIQTVGAGEVVGWSWLFPPYEWHFDARVQETIRAISIDGSCLRAKLEKDPALGYDLMKRFTANMIKNLHSARLQLLDAIEESKERHG